MTPEQRSRAMKRVKLKNGPLELQVQRQLRSEGLRFRRHVSSLPGSPDIVLTADRIAIFVDGDFWHGWRLPEWEHKLTTFWKEKLRANRARDQRNFRRLRALGWRVIRAWQHEVMRKDQATYLRRIREIVDARRSIRSR